jgi:hypothetical protein
MLDKADLTVLVGLVRRAKGNVERRQERRQHLGKVSPPRDAGRTKAHKLARLQAKLEELQSQVQQGGVPHPIERRATGSRGH